VTPGGIMEDQDETTEDKLAAELDLGSWPGSPWPVLHSTCRICGGLPGCWRRRCSRVLRWLALGGRNTTEEASREQATSTLIGAEQRSRIARRRGDGAVVATGQGVLTLARSGRGHEGPG